MTNTLTRIVAALLLSCAFLGAALAQNPDYRNQTQVYNAFKQLGRTADISVTSASQDVTLPVTAPVAVFYNTGSNYAYVALSAAAGTVTAANGTPVPPGSCAALVATGSTHLQAITASGTTVLQVALGWGAPGSCGGAGSGGSGSSSTLTTYAPLSPMQAGLSVTGVTALTVPNGSTYASVCARNGNVNYSVDGSTIPSPSTGMQLAQNQCVPLQGLQVIANFRAIAQTGSAGVLDVSYFSATGGSFYAFTPVAPMQTGLTLGTAQTLTVPVGAAYATICARGAALYYTLDGTTTPTGSSGMSLLQNGCISLYGSGLLTSFKAIQQWPGGLLDVSYFK